MWDRNKSCYTKLYTVTSKGTSYEYRRADLHTAAMKSFVSKKCKNIIFYLFYKDVSFYQLNFRQFSILNFKILIYYYIYLFFGQFYAPEEYTFEV